MIRFALIDETKSLTSGDLFRMAAALQINARHCWQDWREHLEPWIGDIAPSVFPWSHDVPLPTWGDPGKGHVVPVFFVDDTSRDAHTLAYHYVSFDGRPMARVIMPNTSGVNEGATSATESAAHEVIECMGNPWARKWHLRNPETGQLVAWEFCDPVQDHYIVQAHGIDWRVANFVRPPWFGLAMKAEWANQYDALGTLDRPLSIGPEGYLILSDPYGQVTYELGNGRTGLGVEALNALAHPLSRLRRIMDERAAAQREGRVARRGGYVA